MKYFLLIRKTCEFWIYFSFIFLSFIYIHPGEIPFIHQSKTQMLSSGVDPEVLPGLYQFYLDTFKENPMNLFWGSVNHPYMDAPEGLLLWNPLIERIQVLIYSLFVNVEQIPTAIVITSLFLNALVMYLFSRKLGIDKLISWGMGIAWAFNPYTRAMAKVFIGLTATYHLPMIFLGLLLILRDDKNSKIKATFLFLIVASMTHYYVVALAMMIPLIIGFLVVSHERFFSFKDTLKKVLFCSLPGLFWILFSLIFPHDLNLKKNISPFPQTGETTAKHHPYLDQFAAYPMDYLAGDIGMGIRDINPLRQKISKEIIELNYPSGHTHDRAVGIRWTILLISILVLWSLFSRSKCFWPKYDRSLTIFFFIFGIVSFWFALPPDLPFESAGGSYWIHQVVSQIRIPSRAGIGVHFALLLMTGLFLKNFISPKYKLLISTTFVLLLLLELPPLYQDMPLTFIKEPYPKLSNLSDCGLGMRFPYVSLKYEDLRYLRFIQKMRGSKCGIINSSIPSQLDKMLYKKFKKSHISIKNGSKDKLLNNLKSFVQCVPLSWLVIESPIKTNEAVKICTSLNWDWFGDGVCINSAKKNKKNEKQILNCLEKNDWKSNVQTKKDNF